MLKRVAWHERARLLHEIVCLFVDADGIIVIAGALRFLLSCYAGDTRALVRYKSFLLWRQKAVKEVAQADRVCYDAPHVELTCLEVDQFLDGPLAFVLPDESTADVKERVSESELDRNSLLHLL